MSGLSKVEGHNVLITGTKITVDQMKLVDDIVEYYSNMKVDDETAARYKLGHFTRKELRDAHGKLRGRKAAPYFISKNIKCKVKAKGEVVHGMYNVSGLSASAESIKAAEEAAKETPEKPAKKKKAKAKKGGSKKEKGATKKGKKVPVEAPAEMEAQTS